MPDIFGALAVALYAAASFYAADVFVGCRAALHRSNAWDGQRNRITPHSVTARGTAKSCFSVGSAASVKRSDIGTTAVPEKAGRKRS